MAEMNRRLLRIALLGAITGLMAGALVILFRLSIELIQQQWLPHGQIGNYEALPAWQRLLSPLLGALLLGFMFERISVDKRTVGIVHLLDYLRYRKQRLPIANAIVQFLCGWLAIVSGQSVDREGPGVHLGAANVTLLGRRFKLSEDENYLLAAAGGAAAIAASYNTPLAGVIFVIEVFRVRYAVNHIVPVMVATVIGTVISRLVYGAYPAFEVPTLSIGSLAELPVIMLMGIVIGVLGAAFIQLSSFSARRTLNWRPLYAFAFAGLLTGVLAQWSPAIMGVSYDAIDRIFHNNLGVSALLLLLVTKLVATAVSVGARLPGGLIGPSLILGGAVGGLTELLTHAWYPFNQGSAAFYALTGMVAMMGASLRAPLAALVALMELTGNLNIILPGMIVVVSAEIATRALVGDRSAFTAMLKIKQAHDLAQQEIAQQQEAERQQKEADQQASEADDNNRDDSRK